MRAYVFQSALICTDCASEYCDAHDKPDNDTSDTWPDGPYSEGGGEADCPQHCDMCQVFLENPLTDDGHEYVQNAINKANVVTGVLRDWSNFYGIIRQ
jgi:hypothetical protein